MEEEGIGEQGRIGMMGRRGKDRGGGGWIGEKGGGGRIGRRI